jgi:uncharacterized protein (DUF1778 family)
MRTGVRGETETIAIRLPKSVVAAIDAAAADLGTSRGNFLASMIIERMEKKGLTTSGVKPLLFRAGI